MKTIILVCILGMLLTACGGNYVSFSGIKVINDVYKVTLNTSEKGRVSVLEELFNQKVGYKNSTPEFKYLIELNTSAGAQRWKYSINGFLQIHKQGIQPIYVLQNIDEFNELALIN